MVRLKLFFVIAVKPAIADFNPTMVRLKLFKMKYHLYIREKFQSHNGSIKTKYLTKNKKYFCQISIPQWFD